MPPAPFSLVAEFTRDPDGRLIATQNSANGAVLAATDRSDPYAHQQAGERNRYRWQCDKGHLIHKGGKQHAMPYHHNFEECLVAYLDGAGLRSDPKGPLFRTIGRGPSS